MCSKLLLLFIFPLSCLFANSSQAEEDLPQEKPVLSQEFLDGYLQCLMEEYYQTLNMSAYPILPLFPRSNFYKKKLTLYGLPQDFYLETQIRGFALQYSNVKEVEFKEEKGKSSIIGRSTHPIIEGNWFGEMRPLFPSALANPKRISYSLGYRSYDRVLNEPLIPISMGDQFRIFQTFRKNKDDSRIIIGVEAGVWAAFIAKYQSLALINADYYIGIPFIYSIGKSQWRFRLYHESSHLGDELLAENPTIERLNPSMEAIDIFWTRACSPEVTLFFGAGRVLRSDESFKLEPYYMEYGFNWIIKHRKTELDNLTCCPFLAVYVRNRQEDDWDFDTTIAVGYQWKKTHDHGRRARLSLEYHNGFSVDGQFSKESNDYLKFYFSYGF